ncbi:GNAT family N-acetyltransferase [Rhodophyticola sp.]|jgi:ribosomal protein S18 acetylase RimI-like enzyme|uniref:GNAT family N-acetyltransferase n=1 Tax=Rhodophyticola sp. TaxID=2680032 RepID=UPI003D2BD60C
MTPAHPTDRDAITDFLSRHILSSMFPLSNLTRYGMGGGHPHATRFWVIRRAGRITDVLGLTGSGMVLPQCPTEPWQAARDTLSGARVTGIVGAADQVRPLSEALGLSRHKMSISADEPQYALDLERLVIPDGPGRLIPATAAHLPVLLDWRAAYQMETLGQSAETARVDAASTVSGWIEEGSHMILTDGKDPLALTGINASAMSVVQVGGVYTPPALRRRGHARRAVALHLAQLRDAGRADRATLFAASEAAARAYITIGFHHIGTFTISLLKEPAHV